MTFQQTIDFLVHRLQEDLPGKDAQIQMAPRPVDIERFRTLDTSSYKIGAVMILLFPDTKGAVFPLMQRPLYDGVHSGQISLPGGKQDPGDEDVIATAIRETKEEIGVDISRDQVLGRLSDMYIPPSKFKVSPVVAYLEKQPLIIPDAREVVEVFSVPLRDVLRDDIRKTEKIVVRNTRLDAPYFDINNKIVWGATAMILSEFCEILKNR